MKLWTLGQNRRIVQLKYYRYCWEHYALLASIQNVCPNQLVELVGSNGPLLIPIHALDLESFRSITLINASSL